jgi:hypothetical protein
MLAPVDIEAEVVTLLDAALPVDVSTRLPNPVPGAGAVRVTRAGGNARNLMQSDPRLLVECFAADSVTAFNLARLAYAHLWATYGTTDTWGGRASLTEPVNFPDPSTKGARYQFVAQILTNLTEV